MVRIRLAYIASEERELQNQAIYYIKEKIKEILKYL